MALIVVLQNISGLADVSDYKVEVYVNHTKVAGPFMVKGHTRDHGWEALVKQWAKGLKINHFRPSTKPRRPSEAASQSAVVRAGKQGS